MEPMRYENAPPMVIAGLVTRAKAGRTVTCKLRAGPMEQATEWLNRYQRFWAEGLDKLAALLGEDKE